VFTSINQAARQPRPSTPLPVLIPSPNVTSEEHKEDVLMSGAFSDTTQESETPDLSDVTPNGFVSKRQLFMTSSGLMAYPLVYVSMWIVPTCVTISQMIRPAGEVSQASLAIADICLVLPGFINAILYAINERRSADWRNETQRLASRIVCLFKDDSVCELPGIRHKRASPPLVKIVCDKCVNLSAKIAGRRQPMITHDMIQKPKPVYFGPNPASPVYESSLTAEMVQAVYMDSTNARPHTPVNWI